MSMRIEGQMDAKVVSNTRSAETRAAGPESTTGHMLATSQGTDNVSLSGASGLAALAKQLTPELLKSAVPSCRVYSRTKAQRLGYEAEETRSAPGSCQQ
jgi:hypothetical protein